MTQNIHPPRLDKLFDSAPALRRASIVDARPVLSVNGAAITDEQRDELLRKVKAGEHVELAFSVLAFTQNPERANRNFVEFDDAALDAMAASAKGRPFLRDHEQGNTLAVGGKITAARVVRRGPGDADLELDVTLTAPWAVEMALRGLLSTVSIGWWPDAVLCTACGTQLGERCYHYPGQRLREETDSAGNKKFVGDRNGPITVRWRYAGAATDLLEVSAVPVPAVPEAHIRTALAAAGFLDEDDIAGILEPRAPAADGNDVRVTVVNFGDSRLRSRNSTPGAAAPQPALNTEHSMSDKPTEKIVVLTESQHAHFGKLSPADQAAFLSRSSAERDAEVKAALDADPVVYTAKDGTAIRKSDGAVALMFAKQADAATLREEAALAAQRRTEEAAAYAALCARAKEQLAGMAGKDEVHVAILAAIEGIADEAIRTEALRALNAWRAGAAANPKAPGVNPGEDAKPTDALAAFNAGIEAFAAKHGIKDRLDAQERFLCTPEGKQLKRAYDATRAYGTNHPQVG